MFGSGLAEKGKQKANLIFVHFEKRMAQTISL
jgi:hypothetical protein